DGVHLIRIGHCPMASCEIADAMQRGNVAVHRIEGFEYDELGPSGTDLAQQAFEMLDVVVSPNQLLATRLAHTLDHRIVIERVGENQAVGNELRDRRYAGQIRYIPRSEDERRVLAVQIGQLPLKLDQGVIGPCNIARAARAHTNTHRGFDEGGDYLGVLSHSEIVVRAPDNHFGPSFQRMANGVWKAAGDALEVGKHAIASLA